MWAVGCVIYWLLCGYTPFRGSTIPKVLWNIEKGSFRWPKSVRFSDDVKALIQSLLKRDPGERPSAKQLLSHPWVKGGPVSAKTLMAAGKQLLQGAAAEGSLGVSKPLEALQARGDSPLVQQLIADARVKPEALPWPESPGKRSWVDQSPRKALLACCNQNLLRKSVASGYTFHWLLSIVRDVAAVLSF